MTLEILTHNALLPARHGFFTRCGGVSSGIFAGLNCGPGSSDQADAVAQNRRLVAGAFGLEPEHLATVHQVHSAEVLVLDAPTHEPRPRCDAMVTCRKGIALGILTADCQPVLFADPVAGVIGAAHAGWKGALGGVLGATVAAMEGLGATRGNIAAVIGPCISQAAYEVGPEFLDQFTAINADHAQFFKEGTGDRFMFDLPAFGLWCLCEAGVAQAHWSGHCTYSDPERFFSYRRATHRGEADYGRLISAIALS